MPDPALPRRLKSGTEIAEVMRQDLAAERTSLLDRYQSCIRAAIPTQRDYNRLVAHVCDRIWKSDG